MFSLNELREFALPFGYQGETRQDIHARALAPGITFALFCVDIAKMRVKCICVRRVVSARRIQTPNG